MHSGHSDIPSKDLSNGKWQRQKVLVLDKSELERIREHTQFFQKDIEYAKQQYMLREKLKEESRLMVKDWHNTLQVSKCITWTYFRRIKM
jgi:hypothetical protein